MKNIFSRLTKYKKGLTTEQQIAWRTSLSFLVFFVLIGAGVCGWMWLRYQPEEGGTLKPLRKVLNGNEKVFGSVFNSNHLTKTYPISKAVKDVRVNGDAGMTDNFDTASWQLHLVRKPGDTVLISIGDIKKLPKTEIVFDFKCIEGWSQVTHWGGVRFSDFVNYYHLSGYAAQQYLALATPDNEYYVGIDMPSALHPQTLLCYEMNGKPLPKDQGAPLRLIIPVKYGIKSLKRIGTMYFSNSRPPDYWAERGYDYYAGL